MPVLFIVYQLYVYQLWKCVYHRNPLSCVVNAVFGGMNSSRVMACGRVPTFILEERYDLGPHMYMPTPLG